MVEGAWFIEWLSCLEELSVVSWQLERFSLRVTPTNGPQGQVSREGACGRQPGQNC
jgi:hypothetical protein